MRILVAEDEVEIASQYESVLTERNHEVIVTHDGNQCLKAFYSELDKVQATESYSPLRAPFDAIILDYRMPKRDGMKVAEEILAVQPKQRILFASAYVLETLADSVRTLQQVVELIQKPFELDTLADLVEDKSIWQGLEAINANVKAIKDLNPSHREIRDLLEGLRKIQKGRALPR
ncbi:MAG: response regulator [Nitrososphaera sp.]|jgi:DNA-binding response OmpR family regulator